MASSDVEEGGKPSKQRAVHFKGGTPTIAFPVVSRSCFHDFRCCLDFSMLLGLFSMLLGWLGFAWVCSILLGRSSILLVFPSMLFEVLAQSKGPSNFLKSQEMES